MCCYALTRPPSIFLFFFFNDTATTEIYTLSLHDALPISRTMLGSKRRMKTPNQQNIVRYDFLTLTQSRILNHHIRGSRARDRKSTRLNSSHQIISYAVFCLKKKKKNKRNKN